MTLQEILIRIVSVKMWILFLTIQLVVGVLQKPLQFERGIATSEHSDHAHTHEFSFEEIFKLIWIGQVEHRHSHDEDSSHSHAHHHSVQFGSTIVDLEESSFQFSFPQIESDWCGLDLMGPQEPFLSEILRPPIQS